MQAMVARVQAMVARPQAARAALRLSPAGGASMLEEGLDPLIRRGLVSASLKPVPTERALLAFYAAEVPEAGISALPQT